MSSKLLTLVTGLACACFSTRALAQVDNGWVAFEQESHRLRDANGAPATILTNTGRETDFAWGDLDGAGFTLTHGVSVTWAP